MALSRRAFLAATGAAPWSASVVRTRAEVPAEVQTVVVGAGAAGLAAAKELRRLGRSFVVIEARDRIGGRAFTDTSLGASFDAGAQYIHWGERNPWKRIAEELSVPISDEQGGQPPLVFLRGRPISDAERARRRGSFSRVWSLLNTADRADRSFGEAVRGAPEDLAAAAAAITRLSLGEEPGRVSLADYQRLWAGDDYVIPTGYGDLVARYGADVPVRLSTPVRTIRWGGPGGVEVETAAGTVRARNAIVTASVGVLQAGAIRFDPPLPAATQDALGGLVMGAYTKVALKVERAKLGPIPATDYYEIGEGGTMVSFEFWPFSRDLAMAYMGGDHARALCEAGEPAAVDYVTERLTALAGSSLRGAVTGGRLAGWWSDPHARGGYSIALPGRASARDALRQPIGDRLWFAGEATAGPGAMTVGGATLEGARAAGEVARAKAE